MRDNHDDLPEIVDTLEQDGHYFCLVDLERLGQRRHFRLAVSRDSYLAIRRALQTRPFDQMPAVPDRYFFVPAARRLKNNRAMMTIRVEQGRDGKQVELEAPIDLVANLLWFFELKDLGEADHLAWTPEGQ